MDSSSGLAMYITVIMTSAETVMFVTSKKSIIAVGSGVSTTKIRHSAATGMSRLRFRSMNA